MEPTTLLSIFEVGASLFGLSKEQKQADKQNKLAERQMQLSEQQYYDQQARQIQWNEKYGSIEHNMLQYVKSLDANTIYGIQEGGLKRAYANARKNMDSHLASRGFDVAGGVSADAFIKLADQEAQHTVEVKQASADYVLKAQQGVLHQNPQPNVASTANMQNAISNQMAIQQQGFKGISESYGDISQSIERAYKRYRNIPEEDNANVNTTTALRGGKY